MLRALLSTRARRQMLACRHQQAAHQRRGAASLTRHLRADRLRQDGWTAEPAASGDASTPQQVPDAAGEAADQDPPAEDDMVIRELGVQFAVAPRGGQKTGHYCDQRDTRLDFAKLCNGKTVLDSFCYSGGFGIAAALQGAAAVDCVDSSAPALALADKNAHLNGVSAKLTLVKSDVGDFLDKSVQDGR
jgi:ribosomal protein L11 methylase PrmA